MKDEDEGCSLLLRGGRILLNVGYGDACAAIGLVGGFEAFDLGMPLEKFLDALPQFARAVAVDYPNGTGLGSGDRPF